MAGIGEAVAERADLVALLRQPLEHAVVHHHRADRQIGRGQRLGAGQDVGLHVQRLAAPVVAGAPEPADHLVGDEQHVVLAQHRLDLLEVRPRRDDHAAGAHDRLGPHRRHRVRPLGQDHLLQFLGAARGKRLLALAGIGAVVVVRRHRVDEARQRHVERAVIVRDAGERGGRQRDAVIALQPADDLLLVRPPDALLKYQTILMALSFASEPELAKNTLLIGTGARAISISDRSISGSCDFAVKA